MEVEEKPINNPIVSRTHEVKIGNNIIWLDCVFRNLVETCNEIEEIPKNMHWIQDSAGTVFLTYKQP